MTAVDIARHTKIHKVCGCHQRMVSHISKDADGTSYMRFRKSSESDGRSPAFSDFRESFSGMGPSSSTESPLLRCRDGGVI